MVGAGGTTPKPTNQTQKQIQKRDRKSKITMEGRLISLKMIHVNYRKIVRISRGTTKISQLTSNKRKFVANLQSDI